jgi:NarL family two-component system response regulator LiaR
LIKILIVDDHAIVRAGLKALFDLVADMQVVAESENGAKSITAYDAYQPDIVLMDLVMPEMNGIQAIQAITDQHPQAHILALTSFSTDDMVFPAIKAGALGYILKDTVPAKLLDAIRQVHAGNLSLPPEIATKVLAELGKPEDKTPTPEPLTAREFEVLRMMAKGMGNQEIAEALVIAPVTVRTHVSRILGKLHLANRVQATLYALREGIVTLEGDGGW